MKRSFSLHTLIPLLLVTLTAGSYTPTASAIDPLTTTLLIGGVAAVSYHRNHLRRYHAYTPSASTSRYPTVAIKTDPIRVRYLSRPRMRGHACGYDGICIGH